MSLRLKRSRALVILSAAAWTLLACSRAPAYDPAICAGPPLTVEGVETAWEEGYEVHRTYKCITRESYRAMQQATVRRELSRQVRIETERTAMATQGLSPLVQQRHGFVTTAKVSPSEPTPLPYPPPELFVRSDFKSPGVGILSSYVTPDPKDNQRHPAIVWLTGGDSNALGNFWTPGSTANDQSAHAFRDAGVVMMFPTLRGSHGQPGQREFLLGETDDVIAAAAQLAKLAYVDPERIYLGGHSTGATLALMVAVQDHPFRAVFAFGPAARVTDYPQKLSGIDFRRLPVAESRLRSPLHWIGDVTRPTYIVEGDQPPANVEAQATLCGASNNPRVRCLRIPGANHFSVLAHATPRIAYDILNDEIH